MMKRILGFIPFATVLLFSAPLSATNYLPDGVLGAPPIHRLAVSPDGQLIAVARGASFIEIREAATNAVHFLPAMDDCEWMGVAFSPDGQYLLSAGRQSTDGFIVEWKVLDGSISRQFVLPSADFLNDVAYSSDGSFFIAVGDRGSSDGQIGIWETASGSLLKDVPSSRELRAVDISPDGNDFAVCTDTDARLFSTSTATEIRSFNQDDCRELAFSPDGTEVATAGDPGGTIWEVASGAELRSMDMTEIGVSLSYSPDGTTLVVGTPANYNDRGLLVFDSATGNELWCESTVHPSYDIEEGLEAVVFMPDGRHLYAGSTTSYEEGTGAVVRQTSRLVYYDSQASLPHQVLEGHSDGLTTVAYSADGNWIATGARDDLAIIWNAATGAIAHTLSGHTGNIASMEFSDDSTLLLTGSYDGTARVWNVSSGALLKTLTESADVEATSLSPDGSQALVAVRDGFSYWVDVWSISSATVVRTISAGGRVHDLDWHPTADEFVAAVAGSLSFFSPSNGSLLRSISYESASRVAYSSDGSMVVAASTSAKYAPLFNAATGAEIRRFSGDGWPVDDVAISADDSKVATGSQDDNLRVYSLSTGAEISRFGNSRLASLSPDGSRIVTANWYGARVYDADRPDPRLRDNEQESVLDIGQPSVAICAEAGAAVSADGKNAKLWDLETGNVLQLFTGHHDNITSVSCSSDATIIATASYDRKVRIHSGQDGSLLHELSDHTDTALSVAVSPDGTWLVSGSADNTARIYNVSSGAAGPVLNETDTIDLVAFSPDGTRVLTASQSRSVSVWNRSDGLLIRSYPTGYPYNPAAFSPDGAQVLTQRLSGSSYWIVEWNPDTGTEISARKIAGGSRPSNVLAYAADGRHAFIALDYPGILRKWDLLTDTEVKSYSAHYRDIEALAVGGENNPVLTGGNGESQILEWDAPGVFSDGFESGDTSKWSFASQ